MESALRVGRAGPQHHRVEGALVQVVEGGVGGQRCGHLAAARRQGVGQRQEFGGGLAHGEHRQRAAVDLGGGGDGGAAGGQGGGAQLELLLAHRGARQRLQPGGHLRRVCGRRQHEVEAHQVEQRRVVRGVGVGQGEHRQAAGRGGVAQPARQGGEFGVVVRRHDHRVQRQVLHRDQGGVGRGGVQRRPAQRVEPLGQRAHVGRSGGDHQHARRAQERQFVRHPPSRDACPAVLACAPLNGPLAPLTTPRPRGAR